MTNKERLQTIYKIIRKIVKKPNSLFLVLKDETEYESYLHKNYHISSFPTINIQHFLENKQAEVNNYVFLEGGSWITDLALLKSLAGKFELCDYLEIGSWRGESVVNVADVKEIKCVSLNLSPEQIIARGLPEKYAYEHGCLIKNRKNIETIHADSLTFDFSTLNRKFDLIFVDGDHTYEAVKSDTRNVFRLLKNEDSIIVWHDYGFDPVTPRYSVISAILDGLPEEEHQHLYHVSNTLCAIYIKNQAVKKHIENSVSLPNKVFQIQLECNDIHL